MDPKHGGPLDRGGVYGYQYTVTPQAAERGFTDGFIRLDLDGDEAATITAVRSNGGDGVVEFLGSKIAGPDRRFGATQSAIGWPPSKKFGSDITDAEGAELLPTSQAGPMGYELLLGYEVLDPDSYGARDSVTIDYRVGDVTYTFTQQARIVFCPLQATRTACADYAEKAFPNG